METGQMRRADEKVTIIHLNGGLRLVHRKAQGAAVDYCGVIVKVGSRDDKPDAYGMAHFVEHTIFKGTHKRSSWHILNRMERIGGELNAYTTKEETVVYTAAPAGNMRRAIELVADLCTYSRFPDTELDKEREVVADEINSYLDTPADAVLDDFEDLIFAGTPLGHNILGNVESISKINSDVCRSYLREWYTTSNTTLFYYGSATCERVAAAASEYFANMPEHTCNHISLSPDFKSPSFDVTRDIGAHQAHTVMGTVVPGMFSPSRHAMALFTNIIGGPGMNSLLNVELRERRGLVYSVEASTSLLRDCGLFTIYFGCDAHDTKGCIDIVNAQMQAIADNGISDRTLAAAKKQYLGQLAVSSDNRENVAISTGRAASYYDHVRSSSETIDTINSITIDQIIQAAHQALNLSTLTFT